MILDLHGTRHQDVTKLLDEFLWENIKRKNKQVEIITGNSEIMKSIVKECLKDYGIQPREGFLNTATFIVDL